MMVRGTTSVLCPHHPPLFPLPLTVVGEMEVEMEGNRPAAKLQLQLEHQPAVLEPQVPGVMKKEQRLDLPP